MDHGVHFPLLFIIFTLSSEDRPATTQIQTAGSKVLSIALNATSLMKNKEQFIEL